MKGIYFNNREGHTVLSEEERRGLLLSHITSLQELNEAEQANINEGMMWLATHTPTQVLEDTFFIKLHKKLFGHVWRWAGHYRTSEKNIGIEAYKIPMEMKKLIDDARYWLEHKTYTREEFLTHFHHRLVSIHPFPNGNGRFSRILTNLICQQAGWRECNWLAGLDPVQRRHTYIEALRSADTRKYGPLLEYFAKA